ncbi:MAG: hypothetical protein V4628_14095 [Pseudomonadota bacterium]
MTTDFTPAIPPVRNSATLLKLSVLSLATLLSLLAPSTYAADDDDADNDGFFGLNWLDQTQANFTGRADTLARRLDRAFGVERSDLEAAYSSLRLGTEFRYEEGEGFEPHLRLRGTLHLPRVNERLSLIFSEDKGEGSSYYSQNELLDKPQSTRVNLEVNLSDTDRHRFDFRVGLRSNLKLRTSVRYRYEDALSNRMQHRLSETVYFIDGQGYGSFTQYQIDRELNSTSLLRWSSEFRAQEDLDTLEWGTSLNHVSTYANNIAMSYYARMGGTTDQNYVGEYQVGVRFRRNIARPWLFIELSPGYSWEKVSDDIPREGSIFASIRLEMAIGRLQ